MPDSKAQAAMEFLVTYGWGLLAIAAAVGAFAYFGFADAKIAVSNRCVFSSEFFCRDASLKGSEDTIIFVLQNNLPEPIIISEARISSEKGNLACEYNPDNKSRKYFAESHWASNGLNPNNPDKYNDGNINAVAFGVRNDPNTFLMLDLGQDKALDFYRMEMFNTGGDNPNKFDIMYSDNNAGWVTVASGFGGYATRSANATWKTGGAHRYWKLLLADFIENKNHEEIQFYETPLSNQTLFPGKMLELTWEKCGFASLKKGGKNKLIVDLIYYSPAQGQSYTKNVRGEAILSIE